MSVSPKSLRFNVSAVAAFALPCFVAIGDAQAQAPSAQGAPLTTYPTCTTKPTAQDSEAAHSAYLLGKRFFEESDYGSASHNFTDAYKLDCMKPELLLNIARANELLGNRAEAVHALETYMQRGQTLSPDDKAQLQRRIDNLKAAIAASAPPVVVAPVAPPGPTAAPPVVIAPPPATVAPLPPPTVERHHTIAPWIVVGAGGAAIVAGAVVYFIGKGDVSDAEKTCPGGLCPKSNSTATNSAAISKGNSGSNLETDGSVVFYGGLAVTAGGLLWHFLEPTGSSTSDGPKVSFRPAVGPGYSGASVVGTF